MKKMGTMIQRRMNWRNSRVNKILTICVFGLALVVTAGCAGNLDEANDVAEESELLDYDDRKETNDMEHEKAFLNDSKPPLDLQVPSNLETATLGLG